MLFSSADSFFSPGGTQTTEYFTNKGALELVKKNYRQRQTAKARGAGTERRWPLEAKVQQVGQQESPRS